jgi:outer membrane protein assembly complex protein YaeT
MLRRLIAAALIALICASAAGAITVDELPRDAVYKIRAVRIEGNHAVGDRAIRAVMLTKAPPWYKPWKRKETLNPALLRTDFARVETLLRESGHYLARVTHELEIDGELVTIVLHVDEGPAVAVGEVVIEELDFKPDTLETAARTNQLPLRVGQAFTQAAYDESRARLERFYLERGFAYVRVEKAAVVDTATDRARVTYSITRGPPAVFGTTRVAGTAHVAPRLVEREITYRPGEPYDPRKIEETQANIFGLRLFRSVAAAPTNLAERSGIVDMAINVLEGPRREVQVGIGYGLEDELRGQLRWQHNDFFGDGRQLGIRLRGSSITQVVEGEFRQPFFLHPRQSLVVPLSQAREEEPGFTVARIRLAPRVDRKLPHHLKISLGYNIEYDDLSHVPNATIARLDEFTPRGFVSSVTGVFERNTTLDLLDPRDGSVVNLTAEQAGGPWHGEYSFYRAAFEAKKYVPVWGTRVIAGRFRIGGGDGFGQSRDLPMFRRFFAGGINSTRGYDRSLVGPLNGFTSPVGGRSLLEGSVEFRTPVYGQFGGVVFFDVGEVRRAPFSYSAGDLQFGTGIGVRYHTIVGPLRVDLGFPLEPPPGEARWKVHFSIGQAF